MVAAKRVMVVYGTRPEAIKVAPLIKQLEAAPSLTPISVVTGQHREMLDQVNAIFGIIPDIDFDIMQPGQSLSAVFARVLEKLDPLLVEQQPDVLVVQGDTTTVFAAALAAFHRKIPVVHLEAGLRSHNLHSPFPEEMNRVITSRLAALHLAPTAVSKANLLAEGVDEAAIAVTGNTVIDALHQVVAMPYDAANWGEHWGRRLPQALKAARAKRTQIVLVTTHRRENWGEPMERIGAALAQIAAEFPAKTLVVPLHRNQKVREALRPQLEELDNVVLTEPLDYPVFSVVMDAAELVVTDSGGVQEEAPSLGKPVLVLRENTERPEAVTAGTVKLVGTDTDEIVHWMRLLLTDQNLYQQMAQAVNPYGDGQAAARAVAAIAELLGVGQRLPDFTPTAAGS